jgi:hypothetical protein
MDYIRIKASPCNGVTKPPFVVDINLNIQRKWVPTETDDLSKRVALLMQSPLLLLGIESSNSIFLKKTMDKENQSPSTSVFVALTHILEGLIQKEEAESILKELKLGTIETTDDTVVMNVMYDFGEFGVPKPRKPSLVGSRSTLVNSPPSVENTGSSNRARRGSGSKLTPAQLSILHYFVWKFTMIYHGVFVHPKHKDALNGDGEGKILSIEEGKEQGKKKKHIDVVVGRDDDCDLPIPWTDDKAQLSEAAKVGWAISIGSSYMISLYEYEKIKKKTYVEFILDNVFGHKYCV